MGFFSHKKKNKQTTVPTIPVSAASPREPIDHYNRSAIGALELLPLLKLCIKHIKLRGLDIPLLFLPFRPESRSAAVEPFVRDYFNGTLRQKNLDQQFMIMDPLVLVGVLRWAYSRLDGGVVTLSYYELFVKTEQELHYPKDAFTRILDVLYESKIKLQILTDFLDLVAAISSHVKMNGHSAHKLAHSCAFLLFSCQVTSGGQTFEIGFDLWCQCALAVEHLLFAYLRDLSLKTSAGIPALPTVLSGLLEHAAYPPMDVNSPSTKALKLTITAAGISPSPTALLRRALLHKSEVGSYILDSLGESNSALDITEDCSKTIKAIEAVHSKHSERVASNALDADWLNFQDFGFQLHHPPETERCRSLSDVSLLSPSQVLKKKKPRPMTPDWSQFMHGGFSLDDQSKPVILPIEFHLPRIQKATTDINRATTSGNHGQVIENHEFQLTDAFWAAWIISLAGESSPALKGSFGRCVVVQTRSSEWIVVEELVKAPNSGAKAEIPDSFNRETLAKKLKKQLRGENNSENTEAKRVTPEQDAKIKAERRLRALVLTQKYSASATLSPAAQSREDQNAADKSIPSETRNAPSTARAASVYALNIDSDFGLALNWAKAYDEGLELSNSSNTEHTKDHSSTTHNAESSRVLAQLIPPEPEPEVVPLETSLVANSVPGIASADGTSGGLSVNPEPKDLAARDSKQTQSLKKKKTGFSLLPRSFSNRSTPRRADSRTSTRLSVVSSSSVGSPESDQTKQSATSKPVLKAQVPPEKTQSPANVARLKVPELRAQLTAPVSDQAARSSSALVIDPSDEVDIPIESPRARAGIPWDPLPEVPVAYRAQESVRCASPKPMVKIHRDMVPQFHSAERQCLPPMNSPYTDDGSKTRRNPSDSSLASSNVSTEILRPTRDKPNAVEPILLVVNSPPRSSSSGSEYSEAPFRGPSPSPVIARERPQVPSPPPERFRQSLSRRVSDLIDKFEMPRRLPSPNSECFVHQEAVITHNIREKWQMIKEAAIAAKRRQPQITDPAGHVPESTAQFTDQNNEIDEDEASTYSAHSSAGLEEDEEEAQAASIVQIKRRVIEMTAPTRPSGPYSSF